MRDYSLIHIVPFDIGYSFEDYGHEKSQTKEDFILCLEKNAKVSGFESLDIKLSHCISVSPCSMTTGWSRDITI